MGNSASIKPLVLFHAACSDGFGAAFAAWLKLGDEAEYVPQQYGSTQEPLPAVCGRDVYILDFSYPKSWMDLIFKEAKRVVWLDHHKSAFEMWCEPEREKHVSLYPLPNDHIIILDNNKSGAYLAWEYFHPGKEVPMLIQHIDDYDRWVFKLKGTKGINKALWSYTPWSFEQWAEMLSDSDWYSTAWTEGMAILRAHDQNVQAVVKGAARKCWIAKMQSKSGGEHWEVDWLVDARGLAANCPPHLQSDVGHELASQSGTFGLLWCMDKGGTIRCSLRSNGDYDVSAIAKAFGGGGHKNAAGFSTDIQTLMGWLK